MLQARYITGFIGEAIAYRTGQLPANGVFAV